MSPQDAAHSGIEVAQRAEGVGEGVWEGWWAVQRVASDKTGQREAGLEEQLG